MKDVKRCTRWIRTRDPMISSPTLSPPDQRLQLLNRRKIFAIYALTLLMYTVASPDPDPITRGEGQLPNPNECNSTLTSATKEDTLTPNPNEYNSTLTSGTNPHLYHKKSLVSVPSAKIEFYW